jgi:hypothetical protein
MAKWNYKQIWCDKTRDLFSGVFVEEALRSQLDPPARLYYL